MYVFKKLRVSWTIVNTKSSQINQIKQTSEEEEDDEYEYENEEEDDKNDEEQEGHEVKTKKSIHPYRVLNANSALSSYSAKENAKQTKKPNKVR